MLLLLKIVQILLYLVFLNFYRSTCNQFQCYVSGLQFIYYEKGRQLGSHMPIGV